MSNDNRQEKVQAIFGLNRIGRELVSEYTNDGDGVSFILRGLCSTYSLEEFEKLKELFGTDDIEFEVQPPSNYSSSRSGPWQGAQLHVKIRNINEKESKNV